MRVALAAAALIALATSAAAQDKPPCEQFKWPLATERSWFETADPKRLPSGGTRGELPEGAFVVALMPSADVAFALPPEGKPKPERPMGAVVPFGAVATPGRYQVTLSDEAWIDIIQAGAFRPALEFSGVHGCPGLRKSVRFDFEQAPLVLLLSSAAASSLKLAIRRLPPE